MGAKKVGIASIGLHIPPLAMRVEELAKLRSVDPNKYLIGLGCKEMALCPEGYTVVDLAVKAAKRALSHWKGDLNKISMIAVGTESAIDMSRPLSAWVADKIGLRGAVRSYEVKHACYGGTVAVRQATEWKLSDVAPGHAALVVASDIALYEPKDPGEPTQGAGAVAMVIDEPLIAEIEPASYPWSEPAFDFWRPVNRAFPIVDSKFSLDCYIRAASECIKAMVGKRDPEEVLESLYALCFHVPFPKMVKKAVVGYCKSLGWTDEKIEDFFQRKVEPTMEWNRRIGNAYSAALWIAVAKTLKDLNEGKRITAFSYGSGFGAELLTLKAGPEAIKSAWVKDIEEDFKHRKYITGDEYNKLRSN
jgi:hydroxymethylglutaryl-CoA synthase